jgi:hypothetical protein
MMSARPDTSAVNGRGVSPHLLEVHEVATPAWDDPNFKGGTMKRCALWLLQEVGEGNTFTKERLRQAFPGISQADRRLRDLRVYGWVIRTSAEDASLLAEDQRFVRAGARVWEPGAARPAGPQVTFSAKEKREVLARDDFLCTQCGISGGDTYPDDPHQTAVLSVSRRKTVMPDGTSTTELVTECNSCRAGTSGVPSRADEVVETIRQLEEPDLRRLRRWIAQDRRPPTALERVWSLYRRLPASARDAVRSELER